MASRTDPNKTDKLCALIVLHFGIPFESAKSMSRESIMSLVVWDHYPVPVAIAKDIGWTPSEYNHPSNLQPMISEDHNVKTAKRDVPEIAKSERISAGHMELQRRLLAKAGQVEPPLPPRKKFKWGKRPMQSRPMRSQGR